MVNITLGARYFVCNPGQTPADGDIGMISRMEAYQFAANSTHPDFPFAEKEAVVVRESHPNGSWGYHTCARFVAGKMVFP